MWIFVNYLATAAFIISISPSSHYLGRKPTGAAVVIVQAIKVNNFISLHEKLTGKIQKVDEKRAKKLLQIEGKNGQICKKDGENKNKKITKTGNKMFKKTGKNWQKMPKSNQKTRLKLRKNRQKKTGTERGNIEWNNRQIQAKNGENWR